MKAAAYLPETLLNPEIASSQEPTETAFNVALDTKLPCWGWLEAEGNESRRIRFGMAMEGAKRASDANAILQGMLTHVLCLSLF